MIPPPEVTWRAPLFDVSGYASEARDLVLGLDDEGVRVRPVPLAWGLPDSGLPAARRRRLVALTRRAPGPEAVVVEHSFPPLWRAPDQALWIGRTMFETDRLPGDWVARCNAAHQVWVPSRFNAATFAAAGVEPSRLVVVPGPVRLADFRPDGPALAVPGARGFTFLSVFDWSLRKGWDVLLRAYCSTFTGDDDVTLVLRVHSSYGHTGDDLRHLVEAFANRVRGAARSPPASIVVLDPILGEAALPRLYRAADCFVLPTRGEGWGRPLLEAMATARPVIATRWSGPADYLDDGHAYPLDVERVVPVPEDGIREAPLFRGHRWAEPSVDHLRQLLRHVYDHRDESRRKGASARAAVARFDVTVVARDIRRRLAVIRS